MRALLLAALGLRAWAAPQGYRSSRPWLPRTSAAPAAPAAELIGTAALPKDFDWRSVGGRSFVSSDVNQHIPQYCGACWIHGTVAALNDRIKAMRNAQWPDVTLGRQAILNCVPAADGDGPPPGCNGGDSWMIHKYLTEHKVPDESCMPYQARNMECTAKNICRNCFPAAMVEKGVSNESCFPVEHWTGYGVSSYGTISGELAMMQEIYARGPIACSGATDDDFMLRYSENAARNEGIYVTDEVYNDSQVDHVMEIAGWGESASGVKYWVIRNSWGTYWGDAGWLKLRRGVNQQLFEAECDWAVPDWHDLDGQLAGKVLGDYVRGTGAVLMESQAVPLGLAAARPHGGAAGIPAPVVAGAAMAAAALGASLMAAAARAPRAWFSPRQPSLLG